MDLRGKLALVTGSTSGIGLSIAHELAKAGCNIIITGFGERCLIEKIKKDLGSYGVEVEYVPGDLLKINEIEEMAKDVDSRHPGGLDILVNNAGFNHVDKIDAFPDGKWDELVGIHLSAPFHLMKRFLPKMKQKGWGRIVNMSSQMGVVSVEGKAVYSAVKSGLIGLTKGVALEVAEYGITCNAVCPTYARTELLDVQMRNKAKQNGTTYEKEYGKLMDTIPTKEPVETSEIADLVLFLVQSKASKQMTGSFYLIDGGYTAK